ncbi:MAG: hypothetical protein WD184_10950 [Acidimicrobiia bacterium]
MRPLVALVRRVPAVAWFTAAHVVVFTIVGVARGQTFLWIYLPLLAASIAVVVWIDHKWGPIPTVLLWLLSIWAAMHLAGGLAPDPSGRRDILYNWWLLDGYLKWDHVVHGFGIGVATAVLAYAARDTDRPLWWAFLFAQGIGVVNETVENIFAALVEGSNVGDAANTAWDLGWHLIGSLMAIVWMSKRGIPGTGPARPELEGA